MFSVSQKRTIAELVQCVLRATDHPELPEGEIAFHLHVDGAESWSWADIKNNGAVNGAQPEIGFSFIHNELQDPREHMRTREEWAELEKQLKSVLQEIFRYR